MKNLTSKISNILLRAMAGYTEDYKDEQGYVKWREVEKDLHLAVSQTSLPLIEFIKEVARPPYEDSDLASLLETHRARAVAILRGLEDD